jgi:hypothetical protein
MNQKRKVKFKLIQVSGSICKRTVFVFHAYFFTIFAPATKFSSLQKFK